MVEIKEKNQVKDQVKHLAKSIKIAKKELKDSQRAFSGVQELNMPYHSGREKRDREFGTYTDVCKRIAMVDDLKSAFRLKHIINSMIKGKTISQIEPKVSDNPYDSVSRMAIYTAAKMELRELGYDWRA